jgi:cardiolipin synthase
VSTTTPFRFLFPLALSLSLLGSAGSCATLPSVSAVIDESAAQEPPQILSARGLLSPEQSRALMERLKRPDAPTDMLERYSAVIESVSGSPLTSGNGVALLVDGPATYAAMFAAIESARDHVNLETFIIEDDETGRRFADLPPPSFSACATAASGCWPSTRSTRSRAEARGRWRTRTTARS